jgi:hypothetical protein
MQLPAAADTCLAHTAQMQGSCRKCVQAHCACQDLKKYQQQHMLHAFCLTSARSSSLGSSGLCVSSNGSIPISSSSSRHLSTVSPQRAAAPEAAAGCQLLLLPPLVAHPAAAALLTLPGPPVALHCAGRAPFPLKSQGQSPAGQV